MNTTVNDLRGRVPLPHAQAMALFAAELDRTLELLRSLTPQEWTSPTDCPGWDVRTMYLHVLGALESGASIRELTRQTVAAYRRRSRDGGPLEAALSATQIAARHELPTHQLLERLAAGAPGAVRARTRLPGLLRRFSMAVDGPVIERWTLGYLVDTIYLRDAWMHRVDASRATGRPIVLTADHDGRIIADVAAEWARRHGRPFLLRLTGAAGGVYTAGDGGEEIELDAVDFCRCLAGRSSGDGLLATIVPF